MSILDLLLLPIRLPFWLLVKWIEWDLKSETVQRVKCAFFITLIAMGFVEGWNAPRGYAEMKAQRAAQMQIQRDDNGDPRRPPPSTWQGSSFPGGAVLHDSNGNHVTCQEQPGFQNWVRCFGDR